MRSVYSILTLIYLAISSVPHAESIECNYGQQNSCPENFYCVFIDNPNQAICKNILLDKTPILNYPFKKDNNSYCWKSVDPLPDSSHAWINARFAIDLHSPKEKLSDILSVGSGHVVVLEGCRENDPQCNGSFGNQVKVFLPNGLMLFYAHLSKVYVKTGDTVRTGDVIGLEGATGNVGDMWGNKNDFHHLHFSVHYDWRSFDLNFHQNPWPGIPSVPFKFIVCDPTKNNECKPTDIDVREFPCSKGTNTITPIKGTL
jgi:hypothetical protein